MLGGVLTVTVVGAEVEEQPFDVAVTVYDPLDDAVKELFVELSLLDKKTMDH